MTLLRLIPEDILRDIFWMAIANDPEFDGVFRRENEDSNEDSDDSHKLMLPPVGDIWELRNDLCSHIICEHDADGMYCYDNSFVGRLDLLIGMLPSCSQDVHLGHTVLTQQAWNDVAFGTEGIWSDLGI